MAYLYRHIRLDKNEPFYIGVGGLDTIDEEYSRAYDKRGRNKIWRNITKKTKYEVEIVLDNLEREESLLKEVEFIALYGRIDLETGTLANLTNGGEGGKGHIVSEQVREYLRSIYIGKPRPEHVKKAMNRLGWNHSKKSKEKISNSLKGENNPFYGKKQPKWVKDKSSKPVINIETGIFYDSIKEASSTTTFKYDYFKSMLNGGRKNITKFIQC